MNRIFNRFAPVLFVIAFVVLTVFGVKEVHAQGTYEKTTATIVSIVREDNPATENNDYHVTVQYTVDGTNYEEELGSYTSSMKEGKEISIIYNPDSPDEITQAGYMKVFAYFGMAAVCLVGGAVSVVKKMNGRG